MKKTIYLLIPCCLLVIFAFRPLKNSLVGHWTMIYHSGQAKVDINSDGTFRAVDDGGGFDLGGKYKLKDNVFSISDSTCGTNYWGKYKATFLSPDSVSSVSIEDSCIGRKIAMDNATLVRRKM